MRFPSDISSKLPQSGRSIFSVMTEMANKNNALNLAQGFPDFPPATDLIKLVNEGMKKGYNQYAPMPGLMPLREIIAEKTEQTYGARYNPDTEITIVPGATFGIYAAITAFVRDGDEVIIFEPAYDCYIPAIDLNGGKAVRVELKYPNYDIDWSEVKKLINFKTRMIIVNTPHNPTGSVLSKDAVAQLAKIVKGSDIIILSDEVYEHIIFDGQEHQSLARYPELAERSLIISSFGKTYHTTGWKMGYINAPENLTEQIRKVYQYMVFSCSTPVQYAYAEILKNPETYLGLSAFYQEKRDVFRAALSGSRFHIMPCSGSYFQLLGYENISELGDLEFAQELTEKHKLASIPISVFYRMKTDNRVLRFCFAKQNSTLEQAAEILCAI
ncbi:MAG: aminotransferase class I/II-fold pyridoxal phosphate-dependent enzyme [Bacteroidetes bacterium]|nr:aminotransferase class I/II-fold pyridoxal phosphate-dependent enzyme [Bacteroidota bacterium]